MKYLGETNCLVFELTRMEFDSYIEKFGEEGWLDVEEMVCLRTSIIDNEFLKSKFTNFFGLDVTKAQFLILQYK